jgi:hypothetical protein
MNVSVLHLLLTNFRDLSPYLRGLLIFIAIILRFVQLYRELKDKYYVAVSHELE